MDVVDRRLPTGNPALAKLNDQYIIRHLAELDKNNLVQRVKGAIIDMLPTGGVCDEKVARKLNMSTRSLQRNLQGKQTSFGKLLEEVRSELADHYIDDISVSLTEVAFICGYSVYSFFSRAYKRWTGVSPNEKRNQLFL